jgi:hypothetical protein
MGGLMPPHSHIRPTSAVCPQKIVVGQVESAVRKNKIFRKVKLIYFAVIRTGLAFWSLSLSKGIKQTTLSAASSRAKWAAKKKGGSFSTLRQAQGAENKVFFPLPTLQAKGRLKKGGDSFSLLD